MGITSGSCGYRRRDEERKESMDEYRSRRWERAHNRWDAQIRKENTIKRCFITVVLFTVSAVLSGITGEGDALLVIISAGLAYAAGGEQ